MCHRPPRVRKPAARHEPNMEQEVAPSGSAIPATSRVRLDHRRDRWQTTPWELETFQGIVFRSETPILPAVRGTARSSLPGSGWQESRNAESASVRPEARVAGTGGETPWRRASWSASDCLGRSLYSGT